ncbi:Transcriptional adapter ada2 [Quaeritorhiza haematococci]|nr:Transcriptional adapter ada2 [Quaeritorhiza haematococci]
MSHNLSPISQPQSQEAEGVAQHLRFASLVDTACCAPEASLDGFERTANASSSTLHALTDERAKPTKTTSVKVIKPSVNPKSPNHDSSRDTSYRAHPYKGDWGESKKGLSGLHPRSHETHVSKEAAAIAAEFAQIEASARILESFRFAYPPVARAVAEAEVEAGADDVADDVAKAVLILESFACDVSPGSVAHLIPAGVARVEDQVHPEPDSTAAPHVDVDFATLPVTVAYYLPIPQPHGLPRQLPTTPLLFTSEEAKKIPKRLPDWINERGLIERYSATSFAWPEVVPALTWSGSPQAPPSNAEALELLHPHEHTACTILRLKPAPYLFVKQTLLKASIRGPFKKRDAQSWFRMDVNKTNRIYDWFVGIGWIPNWAEGGLKVVMTADSVGAKVNGIAAGVGSGNCGSVGAKGHGRGWGSKVTAAARKKALRILEPAHAPPAVVTHPVPRMDPMMMAPVLSPDSPLDAVNGGYVSAAPVATPDVLTHITNTITNTNSSTTSPTASTASSIPSRRSFPDDTRLPPKKRLRTATYTSTTYITTTAFSTNTNLVLSICDPATLAATTLGVAAAAFEAGSARAVGGGTVGLDSRGDCRDFVIGGAAGGGRDVDEDDRMDIDKIENEFENVPSNVIKATTAISKKATAATTKKATAASPKKTTKKPAAAAAKKTPPSNKTVLQTTTISAFDSATTVATTLGVGAASVEAVSAGGVGASAVQTQDAATEGTNTATGAATTALAKETTPAKTGIVKTAAATAKKASTAGQKATLGTAAMPKKPAATTAAKKTTAKTTAKTKIAASKPASTSKPGSAGGSAVNVDASVGGDAALMDVDELDDKRGVANAPPRKDTKDTTATEKNTTAKKTTVTPETVPQAITTSAFNTATAVASTLGVDATSAGAASANGDFAAATINKTVMMTRATHTTALYAATTVAPALGVGAASVAAASAGGVEILDGTTKGRKTTASTKAASATKKPAAKKTTTTQTAKKKAPDGHADGGSSTDGHDRVVSIAVYANAHGYNYGSAYGYNDANGSASVSTTPEPANEYGYGSSAGRGGRGGSGVGGRKRDATGL